MKCKNSHVVCYANARGPASPPHESSLCSFMWIGSGQFLHCVHSLPSFAQTMYTMQKLPFRGVFAILLAFAARRVR